MRRIDIVFRPFEKEWVNPTPASKRERPRFASRYGDTMTLLEREVGMLGAREVVIQVDATEGQVRNDGLLRAQTRIDFPGVRVNLESRHGPLVYETDLFDDAYIRFSGAYSTTFVPGWQSNLRAIALSLEALRKVDRYGVAGRGEQYRGWNALPPGVPMGPAMTYEQACEVLGLHIDDAISSAKIEHAYKGLAKIHHPDAGGDPEMFHKIRQARDLLMMED